MRNRPTIGGHRHGYGCGCSPAGAPAGVLAGAPAGVLAGYGLPIFGPAALTLLAATKSAAGKCAQYKGLASKYKGRNRKKYTKYKSLADRYCALADKKSEAKLAKQQRKIDRRSGVADTEEAAIMEEILADTGITDTMAEITDAAGGTSLTPGGGTSSALPWIVGGGLALGLIAVLAMNKGAPATAKAA